MTTTQIVCKPTLLHLTRRRVRLVARKYQNHVRCRGLESLRTSPASIHANTHPTPRTVKMRHGTRAARASAQALPTEWLGLQASWYGLRQHRPMMPPAIRASSSSRVLRDRDFRDHAWFKNREENRTLADLAVLRGTSVARYPAPAASDFWPQGRPSPASGNSKKCTCPSNIRLMFPGVNPSLDARKQIPGYRHH